MLLIVRPDTIPEELHEPHKSLRKALGSDPFSLGSRLMDLFIRGGGKGFQKFGKTYGQPP